MGDRGPEPEASIRSALRLRELGDIDALMELVSARWMHLERDPDLLAELLVALTPRQHEEYPQAWVLATRVVPTRLVPASELHRALDRTETALADMGELALDTQIGLVTGLALGLFNAGEFDRAARHARRVRPLVDQRLSQPRPERRLLARASLYAGIVELSVGDVVGAGYDLHRVPRWAESYPTDAAGAAGELAFVAALAGDHATARLWTDFADGVDGAWDEDADRPGPHIAQLVAQLLIAGDRMDWVEFDDLLARLRTGRFAPSPHHYLMVYATARTALVRGQPAQALQSLDDIQSWPDPPPLPPLARGILRAIEVEVSMSVDPQRAARLLPDKATTWGEAVQLARWQMANGFYDRAAEELNQEVCTRETGPRGQVYIKLSLAMALHRLGNIQGSADALHQALLLVSDLRSVANVLAMVDASTLDDAAERSVRARDAKAMLAKLSFAPPPLDLGAARPVALTPRENVILQRLSGSGTVAHIAAEFTVSVHTIRNQIQHVYRKLAVNSRRQAVQRAEALGLLPIPTPETEVGSEATRRPSEPGGAEKAPRVIMDTPPEQDPGDGAPARDEVSPTA